ncbi:MAG: sulfatase-like hydrolase/transferase [Fuerstiella sp.]
MPCFQNLKSATAACGSAARGGIASVPPLLGLRALPGLIVALCVCGSAVAAEPRGERPNIIYIMADDLGYGDLSCYGQKQIQTPNIDQLAAEGLKFTDHYAGHTVCRPSRLVLLTGRHSGNTAINSNSQYVLPDGAVTVTTLLKESGYATGGVGKWALGTPGSSGVPSRQGFDFWYGYLDQGNAHNFYPEYLWRNEVRETLPGNRVGDQQRVSVTRETYSHDLLTDAALEFVRKNADRPFFLQAHYTIPHANNEGGRATGDGLEVPDYGPYADTDWPTPEKGFAAMVSRLDRDVGRLIALLKKLKIDDNTVVFFTSDNGPHQEGGHKMEFFDSNGALRGYKRDLYDGGIRVPLIVRWPGRIAAGTTTDHVSAFWDFLPTACELAGVESPPEIDGVSYLPTLLGTTQTVHDHLYWQYGKKSAVRKKNWKAVRPGAGKEMEVYDLATDISEQHNVADQHPELRKEFTEIEEQYAWNHIFDGKSLQGWRGYRQKNPPESGWDVSGGVLHCDGTARVDLITEQPFENYELVVEWRTVADGNSGILIHADESTPKLAFNAPEIQIYATGKRDPGLDHQAGALYALYPAIETAVRPPMAWNTTRVLAVGDRLTIRHNGALVCDARIGSEEWKAKIAASKFSKSTRFGLRTKGHIALQDHGRETWFRTVKIRPVR